MISLMTEEKFEEPVFHYAVSDFTACGEHIVGSAVECNDDGGSIVTLGRGGNVLHTCVLRSVTCPTCQNTDAYKLAR